MKFSQFARSRAAIPALAFLVWVVSTGESVAGPAALNGTYTIDPAGTGTRNFKSFSSAVAALSAGVSGPVVFQVTSTTFYETVTLRAVVGVSATNTIRFVSPGKPAILDANGGSIGLYLKDHAEHYHVENLWIRNFTGGGLVISGSWVVPYSPVRHCSFKNITVDGPATASLWVHAVSLHCTNDTTYTGCRFLGGGFTLDAQYFNARAVFDGCEFDGKGFAQNVLSLALVIDADFLFRNCFVHGSSAAGNAMILDRSHYGTMCWHNVFLASTSQETVRLGGYMEWLYANSFRNNIVINLGTGPAVVYGWDSRVSNGGLHRNDLDHNCYYAPHTTVGTVQLEPNSNGFAYAGSLAGWKSYLAAHPTMVIPGGGSTYDPHSIEGDPGLASLTAPYDIHLTASSICLDAGTTQLIEGPWISYPPATTPPMPSTVPQDFEGDRRPASGVDIGADEISAVLSGSGSGQPGTPIQFSLFAPADGGLAYQMGSSFGPGPIPIDTRQIELTPDSLLYMTLQGWLPATFQSFSGFLDAQGRAPARLNIPNLAALKGVRVYTAFVTLEPSAPSGGESISKAFLFTVQ